jgi:hypothetical protein
VKRPIVYFIPLLFILTVITYRDYLFFLQKPWQIFKVVKPNLTINQYEAVQQHQPYYEIYKLAEEYRQRPDYKIIYFSNKVGDKYIDYNSTFYATLRAGLPVEKYLSEVSLMVNYFFYPRIIPISYYLPEVAGLINSSEKNLIVISDENLQTKSLSFPNLTRITDPQIDNQKIYRPVEPFYIYKKI